jgi:diaminohydroxyphosphoribosylaminopyrimidine deaminase/5-amino-6-(5-phosphoribosylamino)uracil reductase
MKLRLGADAILVGIGTILADDPSLTIRSQNGKLLKKKLPRFILDSEARIPLTAKVICDQSAPTTIVTTHRAPGNKIKALQKAVQVWIAPENQKRIDLRWLLAEMGRQNFTSILVEGGGSVHGSFFSQHLANRIHFFYAPKIIGGNNSTRSVAGVGATELGQHGSLEKLTYRRVGPDLLLSAAVKYSVEIAQPR